MSGKNSISTTLVWVLMGLLILGLGGFGVTNLSGNVRSIGAVGETEIDIQDYARLLRDEIRAEEAARGAALSFAQVRELQLDRRVQAQLITTTALEEETRLMGVSVGDETLRDQIVQIPNFRGLDGSFDREAYRFTLEQSGLSEAEFEEDIRRETARTLLQGAVLGGVEMPAVYTDTVMRYIGERRTITLATLDRSDLATGLPEPDEADLIAYHQTHLPDFTTPLTKEITYAWLTPEMIIDTVEIDEDSLRAAYDERIEEFRQPERRLVERLVFADTAAAEAAKAQIDSGEAGFEALVAERGLDLADVDLGDVSLNDLDAAGPAVFAAAIGEIAGPADTSLGPALFRVNAVLQAHETSFEDALPQLRDDLASDRARRVIDAQIDGIEDLLAGGATIEDLARETDMELGTIGWHAGVTDGIGAYEAFRAAAQDITTEEYPDVITLQDEGILAMRLDRVIDPQVQPLDAVRARAEQGWRQQALAEALAEQVAPAVAALENGAEFADQGLADSRTLEVTRNAFQPDAPPEFLDTVFGLDQGAVEVIEGEGRIFVMRLDGILPPDPENEELAQLRRAVAREADTALAQDLFGLLAGDIRDRVGIELNQQALNAVHSNFQ